MNNLCLVSISLLFAPRAQCGAKRPAASCHPISLSAEVMRMVNVTFLGTKSPEGFPCALAAFPHSSTANHKGSCPKPQGRISIAQTLPGDGGDTASLGPQLEHSPCHPPETSPGFHINKNTKRQIPIDKRGNTGQAKNHRKQTHFP